nr:MAG TPA: hypothetical protein [Caudoviricetes sp.]
MCEVVFMRLSKKSARIFAASMCLAVAVTCTGCKSSEVKNTEKLIDKIGDVSAQGHVGADAVESLKAAQEAFDALGDDKSKVENAQALQDAEATYSAHIAKEAAPIEEAINAIPQPVTVEAEETVGNANKLYARASDDVKAAVSNADVLTAAQKALEDINVQNAIDAINQIGDVSLKSQDAVDTATAAFQKVSSDRRADVTNYDTLVAVTSTLTQLKKEAAEAAGKAAVAKLKKSTDEVEGITWHEPSCMPTYTNTRCYVLPYIGEQSGNYWLRCKVDYAANDWVFFTQIVINIDGVKRDTINFDYGDVTRDTYVGAKLCEVADFAPDNNQIQLLTDIANSQKTIIRFQGSDYYYDFTVPDKDKQGIKDVLAAYEYLK